MVVDTKTLRPMPNDKFIDGLRGYMSNDYRKRVPSATKASIADTMNALQSYRPHMNEFVDALVNRIGLEIYQNNVWSNPLKEFKRGLLEFGDTIEEVQTGLLEAHTYNPDRDSTEKDLFGTEVPDVQSSFHTINRQNMYKVTINETLLKRAFLQTNGLSTFSTQLMNAPTTSDEWDEFLITVRLINEYETNGGFYKVNVPDVSKAGSTDRDAKTALRAMRAMADTVPFVSSKYNAANMPVTTSRDDLIIITTPEFKAAMDVEALSAAFNIANTELYGRIITIPSEQIGIEGFQALMTTKDFFVMADTTFTTTSMFNPHKLQYNYFLHHHGIYSASRFTTAVLFTSKAGTEEIIVSDPVASVAAPVATDRDGATVTTVQRGEIYQMTSDALTTSGAAAAVRWTVEGASTFLTYVTSEGVLHVSDLEQNASIKVRSTSVYNDPANPRQDPLTAVSTLTVTGAGNSVWPIVADITGITIAGVAVTPTFAVGTTAYTATVAGWDGDPLDVAVYGPTDSDAGVTVVAVGDPVTGYTVTVSAYGSTGDPEYTITVTI